MRRILPALSIIALLCAAQDAAAEVFRCEDAEGAVTFQQTPCPEPEPAAEDESATGDDAGRDAKSPAARPRLREGEDVTAVVAAEQEQQRQSAEVEACKQQYRDAIDAIDLEIQNSYTADQRGYYLERLKALTEKMSTC